MNPKRLFHRLYQIICYFALFAVLIYVSSVYFKYRTDTNAAPYTPIRQQLPTVSLCFDLSTLLYRNVSGRYFHSNYPSYIEERTNTIFNKSPRPSQLLRACSYRLFDIDTFWTNTNASECTSLFNITRYRMQGYMCYKLQFEPTEYSFYLNTNSVFDQRKLFGFELNDPFDQGHIILPVLHFNKLPYYERLFNQEVIPSTKVPASYPLSYHLYEITKLPSPYNTNCKHGVSRTECYDVCRETEYFKLNFTHLHSTSLEEHGSKSLKLVYLTYDEPEMFQVLEAISKECLKKCTADSCEQKLAITHVSNVQSASVLTFMIETAHFPTTKVVHIPQFQLADFCLQCCSWASIFMGFSIVSTISFSLCTSESVATMKRKVLVIRSKINWLANSLSNRGFLRGRRTVAAFERPKKSILRRFAPFFVVYTCVTFILFLWQLSNVISNFFLFETTWKFTYQLAYDVELPNTAICLPIEDLMDVHGSDLNESNYDSITKNVDEKLNLTLAEMFNSTPGEEVLAKCRFRNWSDFHLPMVLYDASGCSHIFKFQKVFSAGKICYTFHPHQPDADRSYWRLALNPMNQRAIYSLVPDFGKVSNTLMELIVYLGDGPPYWSKEHPVIAYGTNLKRMQFLSYKLYDMKLLPPPYDTRCSKSSGKFACKHKCYRESVKTINRLSHGQTHRKPSIHRIVQYSDLANQSVNDYWVSLEDKCYRKCSWTACELRYTTTMQSYEVGGNKLQHELVVSSSQNPLTRQVAIARVTFYHLIYQILCSLSFWMGFSFLSLNRLREKNLILIAWKRKLFIELHRLNYLFTFVDDQRRLLKKAQRRLVKRRLRKDLPKLICALGCIIHIAFSADYFRYPTILGTIRKFDTETSYTFTLCIDSYNFFATRAGIDQSSQLKTRDFQMLRSKMLNMSSAEMFKNTPDERNIIVLCRVWGGVKEGRKVNDLSVASDRLMLMEPNGTKCHEYFRVQKSFIQSKICYSFSPKVKLDWNRHQLDNVLRAGMSGCFYMVALNSSLVGRKFSVMATTPKVPLKYLSMWSSDVLEHSKFSRWHIVSFNKYIQRVLPAPYSDGGFTHMMHIKCIDLCIDKLLEPFNKSLTSIFTTPSEHRLITFAERVENDTFNTWLNERLHKCEHECTFVQLGNFEPEMEFTVTDITKGRRSASSAFRGSGPLLTSFYIRRSDSPVVVIVFKAQISFFEFLIIMGSIISIWFGLSVKGMPQSLLRPSAHSLDEMFHELQLKMNILGRFIKNLRS